MFSLSKVNLDMSNAVTKIKFSRCREVFDSRSTAMLHLRDREFTRGEPVVVSYYEDSQDSRTINSMVVVGIRNGRGKDCFRIITIGQWEIVWGVTTDLPDVSSLVHDEVYLWKDENQVWWVVSAPDHVHRSIIPLTPEPHIFLNLGNNVIYVSDSDKQVRAITDTYTKEEIDALINTISGGDWEGLGNLERRLAEAYEAIQEVIAINDDLVRRIDEVSDAVDYINDFKDDAEILKKKTESLDIVDASDSNIAGTFSSVTLKEGNSDDSPIVLDKTTIVTVNNIGDVVEPIPIATLEAELNI